MTAPRTASRTRSCPAAPAGSRSGSSTRRNPTATPIPLPADVPIEGGPRSSGDRHVIVLDRARAPTTSCSPAIRMTTAGSGPPARERSSTCAPTGCARPGWTSADAAGLPILPGLAVYSEVAAGRDRPRAALHRPVHRARATSTRRATSPPRCAGRFAPPMGLRVRLKASVDISHLPYQARIVAQALKLYGLILADNGSPWYISGAPDRRWNDSALHELDRLTGRDFQVVDTRSLPHPGLDRLGLTTSARRRGGESGPERALSSCGGRAAPPAARPPARRRPDHRARPAAAGVRRRAPVRARGPARGCCWASARRPPRPRLRALAPPA